MSWLLSLHWFSAPLLVQCASVASLGSPRRCAFCGALAWWIRCASAGSVRLRCFMAPLWLGLSGLASAASVVG